LKILHCVFTRTLFGSERYAADLASRQQALGHAVAMAVDPHSRVPSLLDSGIPVHRIGRLLRGRNLATLIARERPDILHAHLSAACKALARMRDRPAAVATLHVGYKPHQQVGLDGLIALTPRDLAEAAAFPGRLARAPLRGERWASRMNVMLSASSAGSIPPRIPGCSYAPIARRSFRMRRW
jgi:hypothetical protein